MAGWLAGWQCVSDTVMFRNKPPTRVVQNTANRGGGLIWEHHGNATSVSSVRHGRLPRALARCVSQ
eukprot:875657-Rhodomonas_salina.1